MADQIHLKEAGLVFLPVTEGTNRNTLFQQASRSSGGPALERLFLSGTDQKTISGGGTDGKEFLSYLPVEGDFPVLFQYRDELT